MHTKIWRLSGSASFILTGIGFLWSLALLYQAEGPGRPDVSDQLLKAAGQSLFSELSLVLMCTTILMIGAMYWLYIYVKRASQWAMLALITSVVAAGVLIGAASLQYGMVAVASESPAQTIPACATSSRCHSSQSITSTTSPSSPSSDSTDILHEFSVFEHGAADVAGWSSFGLLGVSILVFSTALWNKAKWRVAASLGFFACLALPVLYLLNISFAFMLLFALWAVAVGITALIVRSE